MLRAVIVPVAALAVAAALPAVPAQAVGSARPTLTFSVAPRWPRVGSTAQLTLRVSGTRGTPTGWVRFRFDGAVIPGCDHVVLHAGVARCTGPRAFTARRAFVAGYKGDATYRPASVSRTVFS